MKTLTPDQRDEVLAQLAQRDQRIAKAESALAAMQHEALLAHLGDPTRTPPSRGWVSRVQYDQDTTLLERRIADLEQQIAKAL